MLILILTALLWFGVLSPGAKILRTIDRGNLATPVGASAYDFYQRSKAHFSDGTRIRIRNKALPRLLESANMMIQKRMQGESMSLSDVQQLARLYGWAAELAPDERRALAGRDYATALSLAIARNPRGALPLLLQSTAEDPTWAPAFNELGKTYVKLNDHSHAAEAYQRAIATDPTWVFPELNLGGVYLHNRQWYLAEQSYLKCIQLDPTLATSWYFLAQVYEAQKRFSDAVDAYEKALQLSATRPSSAFQPDRVRQRLEMLRPKIVAVGTAVPYTADSGESAANFRAKCAGCHGVHGIPNPGIARILHLVSLGSSDVQRLSTGELIQVISFGRGKMPAFQGRLSSDQISGLVQYIRSMAQQ